MSRHREEAELRRLQRIKTAPPPELEPLGQALVGFFKHGVQKRQGKLQRVAECLGRLVPQPLLDHLCIEGLHRGTLTLLCDSASHLYDLKQLLLAGLEQQMLIACKTAGVSRISLKSGRWYDAQDPGGPRVCF